ncbi:MAG: DinB family protein [Anaerolineae bacterium]|nr:DinB family protein [Anaerolineae bacterium]
MNKQTILDQIRVGRVKLEAAIDGLTPDHMRRAGVIGIWSIKDVLAHVTAWESELVTALAKLSKVAPHIVQIDDIDSWNMEQYAINVRRDLDIVLEDFHGVHKHLLKEVEALDEKTLTDPKRFAWMEGEPLSYLIAEESFWHEQEHAEQISAWRVANNV